MTKHSKYAAVALATTFAATAVAFAQPSGERVGGRNTSQMKLAQIPALPTCARGAVQSGDPASTEFILFARTERGCVIPWHWHSAAENLMIVNGVVEITMKDGKPTDVKAGGFVNLPAKHVHNFRCKQTCSFYLYSDGAFDIHYVAPDGTEITPEQALERVNETVAQPPE